MSVLKKRRNYTPIPRHMMPRRWRRSIITFFLYLLFFSSGIIGGFYFLGDTFDLPRFIPAPFIRDTRTTLFQYFITPTPQPFFNFTLRTFKSTDGTVSFQYPDDWTVDESSGITSQIRFHSKDGLVQGRITDSSDSDTDDYSDTNAQQREMHDDGMISRTAFITSAKDRSMHVVVPIPHPVRTPYVIIDASDADSLDRTWRALSTLVTSVTFSDDQAQWKEYKSEKFGYRLAYPSDWIASVSSQPSAQWGAGSIIELRPSQYPSPLLTVEYTTSSSEAQMDTELNSTLIHDIPAHSVEYEQNDTSQSILKLYSLMLKDQQYLKISILAPSTTDVYSPTLQESARWVRNADQIVHTLRRTF